MKILDHLEEWLIAFLMGAATLLIFVAVVHRYADVDGYRAGLAGLWKRLWDLLFGHWFSSLRANGTTHLKSGESENQSADRCRR